MKNYIKIAIIISGLVMLNSCGKKSTETKPIRKSITETVFASGVLVPENQYNLTAQSEGYITTLNFIEGDTVKEGAVLAVIDNKQNDFNAQSANALLSIAGTNVSPNAPAFKQIEANIELAKLKLKEDALQADRYKKLYDDKSVSKLEYENASLAYENSKANLTALQENYNLLKQQADQQLIIQKSQSGINSFFQGNNEIRAVVGGKVYQKQKQLGDYVRKGDVIAVIGKQDDIYAKLNIDETNISKIKLGQKAIVQLNTDKDKNYNGVVSEIYPAFDSQAQSFYCKVKFIDKMDFRISGTQLQANIVISEMKDLLVIPKNYLDYGNKVNVKDKGQVIIETGFVSTEWVEVKGGIDENTILTLDQH
ncbi:MAG TPA: HlyD family efflux transporter periplasmic adaptor subunit [Bacteroidia bacterium]|jgi:multidrug efflux pump subunit AcrA (membrane-fusion protein)|nr:HlyD family efflux transporter periplasmic adaptor subunit [Bacteroidia bacterium]